jgi:hypothetical protein
VDGVKPLGGSRAANGAEGILAGLGLGKLSKSLRKVEHVFRKDGYVEVRETSTAEHPICESYNRRIMWWIDAKGVF